MNPTEPSAPQAPAALADALAGDPLILPTLLCALGFALIHLLTPRLRALEVVPRSRWLSFAGGVAVSYVFLHLLPELGEHHHALLEREWLDPYAFALGGLVVFYGLERRIRAARSEGEARGEGAPGAASFWLHIASFGLYNLLIGYLLLHREETGAIPLALYVAAMGLHFLTNDFGLRQDHPGLYDRRARWLLAAAVLAGWALGVFVDVPEAAVALLFAFLAGGVVLNVLKEELPEERRSRFAPFLLGAAGYGAIVELAF